MTMELQRAPSSIAPDLQRHLELLENARHYDPFAVLGPHEDSGGRVIRAYLPEAARARLDIEGAPAMERLENSDLFEWRGTGTQVPEHYRIRWYDRTGREHMACDPYCFAPQLSDFDLYLFGEGRHLHVYRFLGAHPHTVDGIAGVLFAVWAPGAERVSVVGNFNHWDGRRHPMRVRGNSGVWELFLPDLAAGELYKFEIRNRAHGTIHLKADPYGRRFEIRPATAAVVEPDDSGFGWGDQPWLDARAPTDWLHAPMSIFEVHLGSWQRDEAGNFLNYRALAHRLVDYVKDLGFTHIELLPVTEHPLDASWGYQTVGYFAPTSRYGSPDDFRYFVDYCHRHDIGVLLDWAPGHFPKDAHGLARFDGSAVYEHEDPRQGEHRDWGTLIFNYGRNEVRNFLISSALYWMQEFHIDGLRVDAVASMLYLDYSREDGDWVPNVYGGRENLGAIEFLRQLNEVTHGQHPGTLIIAEESTAWPQVTRPVWVGGLGFSMKWNMGWMHDTLQYLQFDPVHRHYHHDQLTFGLLYAFSENFVLPFSHDEVVHGKSSMVNKMPGDEWQRFANLRALYTYMFTYPGKKLLFMGCEYGQGNEWDHTRELDWWVLQYPMHSGVQALVRDLNRLYREHSALFRHDFEQEGFEWIDCHDASQSVLSYLRRDVDRYLLVVLNFTPVPREHYRIGVPAAGSYRVIVNSDSSFYGGSNLGDDVLTSEAIPWMDRPHSIQLTLPPLAGLVIEPIP
jgi:1,4-alpha-glucan branching enzyme